MALAGETAGAGGMTALYRRYRPATFEEVIGQEHVTAPLMQALRSGRVNHAYLFSGPRGCGKTTSARILARCLNCAQGPTPTPCGECESCVALARGGAGSVDVIEIDAASHGGVDDARDLREKASYGPAQSRYKIYIIDEAHMVTPQGFNALLKIVEEPPEHVKFVFATTEPEKVIGTIRSRTHHYPFRLVPPARLTDYLQELCYAEGIAVEPGVLSFVIRAGGGSVRDSLSVLDQLMAGSTDEGLTYAGAAALLGFTEGELLDATVDALAARDGASVFRQVDRTIETGQDPRRFVEDLLERLRDLIVVSAVSGSGGDITGLFRGLPSDQLDRMRQQAASFGPGELSHAADVVNTGLTEMTGATSPRLQLELICARLLLPGSAGEQGLVARVDRMERRLDLSEGSAPGRPHAVAQPAPAAGRAERAADPGGGASAAADVSAGSVSGDSVSVGSVSGDSVSVGSVSGDSVSVGSVPGDAGPGGARPVDAGHVAAGPGGARPGDRRAQDGRAQATDQSRTDQSRTDPSRTDQEGPAVRRPTDQRVAQQRPERPAAAPADAAGPAPDTVTPPARPEHARGPGGLDTDAIRRSWPDVLGKVFSIRRVTWTFLSEHAQVLDYDGRRLLLGIATRGLATTFRSGQHGEVVRQALIEAIGLDAGVEAIPLDEARDLRESRAAQRPAGPVETGGRPPEAHGPQGLPGRGGSPTGQAAATQPRAARPDRGAGRTATPPDSGRAHGARAPRPGGGLSEARGRPAPGASRHPAPAPSGGPAWYDIEPPDDEPGWGSEPEWSPASPHTETTSEHRAPTPGRGAPGARSEGGRSASDPQAAQADAAPAAPRPERPSRPTSQPPVAERPAPGPAAPRAAEPEPAPGGGDRPGPAARPATGREAFRQALADQARRGRPRPDGRPAADTPGHPGGRRSPADDAADVSEDDESIEDLSAIGQPVIADVLGGVVIQEFES